MSDYGDSDYGDEVEDYGDYDYSCGYDGNEDYDYENDPIDDDNTAADDPTDDDNTAAEDHNVNETNEGNGDSQQDINNEEDAQDIYDELLEQCYPTDYLCAHAGELDYCGSYPQEDEYCEDSEDSSDTNEGNDPPEVNDRDEYSEWAQGVNNAVLRESLPFPYIFAHTDDLGYRDGSNRFSSAGSSLSGYSSNASQGGCGSMSYSGSTSRGSTSVSSSGNTPHFESCSVGYSTYSSHNSGGTTRTVRHPSNSYGGLGPGNHSTDTSCDGFGRVDCSRHNSHCATATSRSFQ